MNHKDPGLLKIGIGATSELRLRVSVATLVRVLFDNPPDGEPMLALERKATLREEKTGHFVDIKVQPFGGALQIHDPKTLQNVIGDFHFDSEQSRSAQDFRLFVQPSAWKFVQQFCMQHFRHANDPVLESDPRRELAEEFDEVLEINLNANQFSCKPVGTITEDVPAPTENVYVRGSLTARIYRIFEARILDPSLAQSMLRNSAKFSHQDLTKLAFEDVQMGGPGWVNAVLTLPLKLISTAYSAVTPEARNVPISFQGHQLDETVAAVLEGIPVPKYRRL